MFEESAATALFGALDPRIAHYGGPYSWHLGGPDHPSQGFGGSREDVISEVAGNFTRVAVQELN